MKEQNIADRCPHCLIMGRITPVTEPMHSLDIPSQVEVQYYCTACSEHSVEVYQASAFIKKTTRFPGTEESP